MNHSDQDMKPPAKSLRRLNRRRMEQWPWKHGCYLMSFFCQISAPLCPTYSNGCVFDGRSRGAIHFPCKGLIQPGKVRKLNSAHGLTLHAAFCCHCAFSPNTHTHTHTQSDVCEKWKAYSRETHLISVSVITIIIGTPLHRERAWRTGME